MSDEQKIESCLLCDCVMRIISGAQIPKAVCSSCHCSYEVYERQFPRHNRIARDLRAWNAAIKRRDETLEKLLSANADLHTSRSMISELHSECDAAVRERDKLASWCIEIKADRGTAYVAYKKAESERDALAARVAEVEGECIDLKQEADIEGMANQLINARLAEFERVAGEMLRQDGKWPFFQRRDGVRVCAFCVGFLGGMEGRNTPNLPCTNDTCPGVKLRALIEEKE